jgi:hypothetical protein
LNFLFSFKNEPFIYKNETSAEREWIGYIPDILKEISKTFNINFILDEYDIDLSNNLNKYQDHDIFTKLIENVKLVKFILCLAFNLNFNNIAKKADFIAGKFPIQDSVKSNFFQYLNRNILHIFQIYETFLLKREILKKRE